VVWSPLGGVCELVLPAVDPAAGGDELCSVAPPEVSALPDGGTVADLEASGGVVLVVGGWVDVSAAKTGAIPIDSTRAVDAKKRIMLGTFLSALEHNASAYRSVSFQKTAPERF
jgi:hypothetical protein